MSVQYKRIVHKKYTTVGVVLAEEIKQQPHTYVITYNFFKELISPQISPAGDPRSASRTLSAASLNTLLDTSTTEAM